MNEPTDKVLLAMIKRKALTPGRTLEIYNINFSIMEKEFPSYLEFMVRSSLNAVEDWSYTEGYMAYEVLPNGLLKWSLTGKLHKDVL